MNDAQALFPVPDDDPSVLVLLGQLESRIRELEELHLDDAEEHDDYRATPPPRIWLMSPEEYGALIETMRPWVRDVWAETFGHLAGELADCWPKHPLAVWLLDLMGELHKVLYLRGTRPATVLSAQAEYFLRLLPQAAQLIETELRQCRGGHKER